MPKRKREPPTPAQEERKERRTARREQRKALGLPKGPKRMPSQKSIQAKVFAMQKVPSLLLDMITHFMHNRGFIKVGKRIKVERQSRNRINGKQDHIGSFTHRNLPPLEEVWNEWLEEWYTANPDKVQYVKEDLEPPKKPKKNKNVISSSDGSSSDDSSSSSSEGEEVRRRKRSAKRVKIEIDGQESYIPLDIGEMPKSKRSRRGRAVDAQTGLASEQEEALNLNGHGEASVPNGINGEVIINEDGQRVKPPLTTRKSEDGKKKSNRDLSNSLDDSSSSEGDLEPATDAEEDAVNEDASAANGGVSTQSKESLMTEVAQSVTVDSTAAAEPETKVGKKEKKSKDRQKILSKSDGKKKPKSKSKLSSSSEASDSSDSADSLYRLRGPKMPDMPKNSTKAQRQKLRFDFVKVLEAPDFVTGEKMKAPDIIRDPNAVAKLRKKDKSKTNGDVPQIQVESAEPEVKAGRQTRKISPHSARALISPNPPLPPTPMIRSGQHQDDEDVPTYISLPNDPDGPDISTDSDGAQTGRKPRNPPPEKIPLWRQKLREERRLKKEAKRASKSDLGRKLRPFEITRLKMAEMEAAARGEDPEPYKAQHQLHQQKKGPKPDWSKEKVRAEAEAKMAAERHWKMFGPGEGKSENSVGEVSAPAAVKTNGNDMTGAAAYAARANKPFERVSKDQFVDPKFGSNAYKERNVIEPNFNNVNGYHGNGDAGGKEDYGARAYRDLIVTKGKEFTKEKNKKKRGSYRGGAIDTAGGGGIKFED